MKYLLPIFFTFLIFSLFSQTPGTVDVTYNNNCQYTNVDDIQGSIFASHLYSNGQILLAGSITTYNGQSVNKIIRVHNNGNIDPTFSVGTGPNGNISGFLVLSNNKILVYGTFSTFDNHSVDSVALIDNNGSIDTSFALSINCPLQRIRSAIEQNGKLILGGTLFSGLTTSTIKRFTLDGIIDTTFNSTISVNSTITSVNTLVKKIELDGNNRIYITGGFSSINNHTIRCIARFSPDGDLDTNYFIQQDYADNTNDIIVDSDGSIIACGSYSTTQFYPNVAGLYGYFKAFPNGQIDTEFQHNTYWAHHTLIIKDVLEERYYIESSTNSSNVLFRILSNGEKDTTFIPFSYTVSGSSWGNIYTAAVENNGKIICGGLNALVRRNVDGTYDRSMLPTCGVKGTVSAVKILPDSKVLIGGRFSGVNGEDMNGIARLMPNGDVDVSFQIGSGIVSNYGNSATLATYDQEVYDIEVQNDGKILVAGLFKSYNNKPCNSLIRLLPSGSIDTTFTCGTVNFYIREIIIQPDGKILLCRQGSYWANTSSVSRLNSDGSIDNTFQMTGFNNRIYTIEQMVDNKIMVGGTFTVADGQSINRLCRLNANGGLDNTYSIGTGLNQVVYDVKEEDNGNILIASGASTYNGASITGLFRTSLTGELDAGFQPALSTSIFITDLYIQNDGKILFSGCDPWPSITYSGFLGVNRYLENGNLDTTFRNQVGVATYTFDVYPDESILAGGFFTDYDGYLYNNLVKLHNDSTLSYNINCFNFDVYFDSVTNLTCNNSAYISAQPINGFPPYQYSWDNGSFVTNNNTIQVDQSAAHYLSVSDSLGCSKSVGLLIDGPTTLTGSDNTTHLVASSFRPGLPANPVLVGVNLGCLPSDGQIILIKDTLLDFISSNPMPDQIHEDTLIWNFYGLTHEINSIINTLHFLTDTAAQTSDIINFELMITSQNQDLDTTNNSYSYDFPVINSYDPNYKEVFPRGECIPHYIKPNEKLRYTIHFQNTGNAEAIDIHVDDSISETLALNSIRIIASSHNMFTQIYPNNKISFVFNNIMLPDSTSDEPNSSGFVVFEIDQQPFLFEDSKIKNKAEIYFDFNSAIITNQVFNTIKYDTPTYNMINNVLTGCDSIFYLGGYYQNSEIHQQIYQNIYGCDSMVQVNFLVHSPSSGTDVISTCQPYTWIDGITYQEDNTTATYMMTNQFGCDSIVTLNFSITTIDSTINYSNNNTLISAEQGAEYQWVLCNGQDFYSIINNQTDQAFNATSNGSYAVIVTLNGCSDTSECEIISTIHLNEIQDFTSVKIIPNPNSGQFYITSFQGQIEKIMLYDLTNRLIESQVPINDYIDFQNISAGNYYLKLIFEEREIIQKIIIE